MLRLAAAGLLALVCFPVYAVDLAGIEAATLMLYDGDQSICSANVVHSAAGETIVLTAAHCVRRGGDYSVRQTVLADDGKVISYTVYNADVFKMDPKTEVAVLRLRDKTVTLPTTDVATLEEANAALHKGARILAAGYPGTMTYPMGDLVFTEGLFTGARKLPGSEIDIYRTTVDAWFGSSGGGLYVQVGENDWKLIGTCNGGDMETPWMTTSWATSGAVNNILKGAWIADLSDPAYTER